MKYHALRTTVAALVGALVGSFSMMMFAGWRVPAVAAADVVPSTSYATSTGVDDQTRIVDAVKQDEPSVVALDVAVNGHEFIPADPFMQFFGMPSTGQVRPFREQASGSGFVYSKSGLIVTNAHVVQFSKGSNAKITVVFANGDREPAHVYAANPAADIALVKVDHYAKLPPALPLGESSAVQAGEWAIAIGEPFALQHSVSVGVVSGLNRTESIGESNGFARTFKGLLQTSAPINPGNSGGPLINYAGQVIGINQSVAAPQAGAQGIGFAIPIDTVKQQVASLEQHPGQVNGPPTPYVGISMAAIDQNLGAQLNYHGKGVAIQSVYQGGPADQAGLQPGDVIQKINGKTITTPDQVQAIVHSQKPGQVLRMEIWSGGFKKLATVKVGLAPADFPAG